MTIKLTRDASGMLWVVGATAAFSINVILAPFIYANGSDPLTLVFTRSLVITLALLGALRVMRNPIRLPAREFFLCVGVGVLMTVQTLAFFTAISLIPVSIGTLIEYTYPFQVAVAARFLYGEALTPTRLALIVGALVGLTMVIQITVPQSNLNTGGVILMVVASTLVAAKIITTHHLLQRLDSRRVSLYLSLTVVCVCGASFLVSPLEPDWPDTQQGWWLLCVTPLSSLVGMLCMYTGLARIGPARSAMLANCEPIFILILAMLLLGETFTPLQSIGALTMLICIVLFQRTRTQ